MTSPAEILERAKALGLDFRLSDDLEHISVPDTTPAELVEEIIAERDGVLRVLARREYLATVRELDRLRQEIDFGSRPYEERKRLCEQRFDPALDRLSALVRIIGIAEEERLLAQYETADDRDKVGAR